jgi:hypothetical protein
MPPNLNSANGASAFVTVFVSGNWVECDMLACALDGYEIESLIIDDNVCRILPNVAYLIGGAKVVVDERDREQALDVIRLVFPGEPPYAGSFITVGIAGSGFFAVVLALPWLLRRRRDARASGEVPGGREGLNARLW